MTLETWERIVRGAGFSVLAAAWLYSGLGAYTGASRKVGRSTGLAGRLRAHTVYAITGIPYFIIAFLLWRPLPVTPADAVRVVMLIVGSITGLAGAAFYFWGRYELGSMYNVSSSLGSELYDGHTLVAAGPYALCRHPMYFGLFLAAGGGLLVYRTWTLVFMCLSLVGALFKAHKEETLLTAEFGAAWERYAAEVPPWVPRLPRGNKEVSHVDTPARG
jgi:protein-S-isoprenylcysteine O-methyltransferase Ste14